MNKIIQCECPNYAAMVPLSNTNPGKCLGSLEQLQKDHPEVPCKYCKEIYSRKNHSAD